MISPAWVSAAAWLLLAAASPALAQTAPPPAKPLAGAVPAQAPSKPPGSFKAQTAAPKSKPAQRAKPNTTYAYCRGVARYMGLRGAERRKTILDCQLGVMPSVSKG